MSTEYELVFDGLYRWKREGNTADAIAGGFMSPVDARRALDVYLLAKEAPVSVVKVEDELEDLNTKADLLKYAELRNAEVPAKYKQPSAIKKFLMGGYGE